jgi:hypothetical protein
MQISKEAVDSMHNSNLILSTEDRVELCEFDTGEMILYYK